MSGRRTDLRTRLCKREYERRAPIFLLSKLTYSNHSYSHSLFNTITGKKVAVLGFSFKDNTGDTRESPAITICRFFRRELARVSIYDPKVPSAQIHSDLSDDATGVVPTSSAAAAGDVTVCSSALEACKDAEAVVVLSPWREFGCDHLDWAHIYQNMSKPAFVFDGRAMLDAEKLKKIGFKVHRVGTGPEKTDAWL